MGSGVGKKVFVSTDLGNDTVLHCNPTDQLELFTRPEDAVIIFVTAVSILTANSLNLAVVTTTPSFHNAHGYLLMALTVGGLGIGCLAALIVYPVWAACWPYGDTICRVSAYFAHVLIFFNACVINLLNSERYIAICHPLRYTTWVTEKRTFAAIVFCLLVSSTPLIVMIITDQLDFIFIGHGYFCVVHTHEIDNWALHVMFTCVITVPSVVVIIITAFVLLRKLAKRSRELGHFFGTAEDGNPSGPSVMLHRNARLFFISVLIIVVYIICWTPLAVIQIINSQSSRALPGTSEFVLISTWLALFVSPVCNTFIYTFTMDAFKNRAKSLLSKFCCCVQCGSRCKSNCRRRGQNNFQNVDVNDTPSSRTLSWSNQTRVHSTAL